VNTLTSIQIEYIVIISVIIIIVVIFFIIIDNVLSIVVIVVIKLQQMLTSINTPNIEHLFTAMKKFGASIT
jgi:hypothetical protein